MPATTPDSSGNGFDGTLVGPPLPSHVQSSQVDFEQEFLFFGTNNGPNPNCHITSPSMMGVIATGESTVEGWIKLEPGSSGVVFNKVPDLDPGSFDILIDPTGFTNLVSHVVTSLLTTIILEDPNPFVSGVYTHVALVRNSSGTFLYKNGVLVDSSPDGGAFVGPWSAVPLRIGQGAASGAFGLGFKGTIDEVRVSDIARYTSDFTPPTEPFTTDANTVALWHMDFPDVVMAPAMTGVASLSKRVSAKRSLQVVTTGAPSLSAVSSRAIQFIKTMVGQPVVNRLLSLFRSLTPTMTGVADMTKGLFKSMSASMTGVATLLAVFKFFVTMAVAMEGVPTLTVRLTRAPEVGECNNTPEGCFTCLSDRQLLALLHQDLCNLIVNGFPIHGTQNINVSEYGGIPTSLGQKLSTFSIPVVLASDQAIVVGGGRSWDLDFLTDQVDASGSIVALDGATITALQAKNALTGAAPTFVTVGVASGAVVASNAARKGLILVNSSLASISLGLDGNPAVLNSGITLNARGGVWVMDEYTFTTGAIAAIASLGASNLTVQEMT